MTACRSVEGIILRSVFEGHRLNPIFQISKLPWLSRKRISARGFLSPQQPITWSLISVRKAGNICIGYSQNSPSEFWPLYRTASNQSAKNGRRQCLEIIAFRARNRPFASRVERKIFKSSNENWRRKKDNDLENVLSFVDSKSKTTKEQKMKRRIMPKNYSMWISSQTCLK